MSVKVKVILDLFNKSYTCALKYLIKKEVNINHVE